MATSFNGLSKSYANEENCRLNQTFPPRPLIHLVNAQILHHYCFQFLTFFTLVPREIENNGYAKFGGQRQGALWSG